MLLAMQRIEGSGARRAIVLGSLLLVEVDYSARRVRLRCMLPTSKYSCSDDQDCPYCTRQQSLLVRSLRSRLSHDSQKLSFACLNPHGVLGLCGES